MEDCSEGGSELSVNLNCDRAKNLKRDVSGSQEVSKTIRMLGNLGINSWPPLSK